MARNAIGHRIDLNQSIGGNRRRLSLERQRLEQLHLHGVADQVVGLLSQHDLARPGRLLQPRGDVHGVKMFFKGLPEPKDRADVIAYLQTLK